MPNFSNNSNSKTSGRTSKIDENQLGHSFIKLSRIHHNQVTKIAEGLTEELREKGIKNVTITPMNVVKYKKAKQIPDNSIEIIAEMTKELATKDEAEAMGYHNEMFEAERKEIRAILENEKYPSDRKLDQINKVYHGSLGRTLDSFGYGKQPAQFNTQVNVILDQTIDKIIDVLERKLNGESSTIISELRSSIRSSVQ